MGIKKLIINIVLRIINVFILMRPIKDDQIAFVSLEANHLESDLKLIYDALEAENRYTLKTVLIHFDKNNLWTNFLYFLNCIKQIAVINTSRMVIITDNNYVISKFKRRGVIVLQVWHATGAVKKFGNSVKREYPINNYDYVIANSDYWKKPFSEAFNVAEDHVVVTGMPRVDHLLDPAFIARSRDKFYQRYPKLKGKKLLLYGPTFRGNIYQGFRAVPIDALKIIEALDEDTVLLYKYHPLLNASLADHERIINMNRENTHELFAVCDGLISDYSSIIFDFSLLNKPMYFFVPDIEEYSRDLGVFVDYYKDMAQAGPICTNEDELIDALTHSQEGKCDIEAFRKQFFAYADGQNLSRVVQLVASLM